MKNILLYAILAVPAALYGIDGQVLINQAAVNAGGGFPYKITQPGSYKLSGNLVMDTTQNGNFNGVDVAIVVQTNNVTIDLNGFTIICNDTFGPALGHNFYAISDTGAFSQINIINGSIRMTSTSLQVQLHGINFPNSYVLKFVDLNLVSKQPAPNQQQVAPPSAELLNAGGNSLVHHVVTDGGITVRCPSTVSESIAILNPVGGSCVLVNNSTSIFSSVP